MFEVTRLILARKKRKLTQKDLAEKIGITQLYYNLIEQKAKVPSVEVVNKISEELSFPVSFFYQDEIDALPLDAVSFRAFTKLTARDRDAALASGGIAVIFNKYLEQKFRLPESKIPDLRNYDAETAATVLRAEWGLGDRPIKNMTHLLEKYGVRIFSLTKESRDIDAFCFWQKTVPIVLVNTTKSAERVRFDLAHELAHLVLHRHGEMHGRVAEQQADDFASIFLMPTSSVLAKVRSIYSLNNLITLKKNWGVSAAALNHRLHRVGLLSEWHYRQLCIEISKNKYRTIEPEPMNPEFSQILKKVSEILKVDGMSFRYTANILNLSWDDLKTILEGLTVLPIDGMSSDKLTLKKRDRSNLKLV